MHVDHARSTNEASQDAFATGRRPWLASRSRRILSASTKVAAFFALSWIVACSDNGSSAQTGGSAGTGGTGAAGSGTGGSGGVPDVDSGDMGDVTITDCTKRTDLDVYTANMKKVGSRGVYKFQLVSSNPAPPAQARHTWIVKILNSADEMAVGPFPIVGETTMPDHNHPIPRQPKFMFDTTTNQYTVTDVDFTLMPGRWKVAFSIRDAVGSDVIVDSAGFDFCIL